MLDAMKEEVRLWKEVYATLPESDINKHTVLKATILFEGKTYDVEYDAGKNYEPSSLAYMWEEGNYGCDCNRRLAIGRTYPGVTDADVCGDNNPCGMLIPLTALKIEVITRDHPVEIGIVK